MGNVETNTGNTIPLPPMVMGLMMWPKFNELVRKHKMNKYDEYMSTFVDIVYQMKDSQTPRPPRGVNFVDTLTINGFQVDKTERAAIWAFLDAAFNLYTS